MISKRYAHHLHTQLQRISLRYVVIAFLVGLLLSSITLRNNYQTMVELREAVYAADKDDKDVAKALGALQSYVVRHMNTNLSTDTSVYPPIQLKYTYERLLAAEQERIEGVNSSIYTEAQAFCEQQNSSDFSGRNRVPCIQQYIQDRGVRTKEIPASLYQFDFVSPSWSPDITGWTIVLTSLLGMIVTLRLILGWWLKRAGK